MEWRDGYKCSAIVHISSVYLQALETQACTRLFRKLLECLCQGEGEVPGALPGLADEGVAVEGVRRSGDGGGVLLHYYHGENSGVH